MKKNGLEPSQRPKVERKTPKTKELATKSRHAITQDLTTAATYRTSQYCDIPHNHFLYLTYFY